jgi:TetR/AcrR family transcriptional regulator, transcriptional repressor for nem operon
MKSMNTTKRLTLTDLLSREDLLEGATTRDSLLGHGIRLFHKYGADGTSIGRLLSVTGKSKSQFYSHFKDRDDFICQILELQMTTMIRISSRVKLHCVEDFENWFAPYVELGQLPDNLGCPVGPLASELSPSNDCVREAAVKQFERWQDFIAEQLTNLAEAEGFPDSFEPKETARHMCCSIQGAFLFGRVYRDNSFILDVRDRFALQLKALATR